MSKNCVYVGRPSRYGNPYKIGQIITKVLPNASSVRKIEVKDWNILDLFRSYMLEILSHYPKYLDPLRKADSLCCWCNESEACHGDVLIELLEQTNADLR